MYLLGCHSLPEGAYITLKGKTIYAGQAHIIHAGTIDAKVVDSEIIDMEIIDMEIIDSNIGAALFN